jgi:carbamoyl-phosphate synthase large subunit
MRVSRGVWEKYGVKLIGVDLDAIDLAENREAFRKLMVDMKAWRVAPSFIANSFLEGKKLPRKLDFPLVIRPSYTLGGTGGSFVHKEEEFDAALRRGLDMSPTFMRSWLKRQYWAGRSMS